MGSCNNDFDLIEEGEDIPVVYGFVNLGDSAQYIRVENAFSDEETNALTLAKQEDAVYYENIEVRLVNEATGSEFVLERVNAANEGYVRDEGDFLVDPNYLYKIKTEELDFAGGEVVRLELIRGDDLDIVTARTPVLPPSEIRLPLLDRPVGISSTGNLTIQVNTNEEVGLIGMRMIMYIIETDQLDPTVRDTAEVVWNIASSFPNDTTRTFQFLNVEGRQFYTTLVDQLDDTKPVNRVFSHFDLEVLTAGKETLEFRRIALANGGLTGSLELPLYSNLSEGIGLFSSKNITTTEGFFLGNTTRDSLANGQITEGLNFVF
jgi:hypothetical protein